MLLQEIRKQLVDYGRRAFDHGIALGTGGNLSLCDRESGLFAISPSGIAYADIQPSDIAILDFTGNIVEAVKKPSSEWDMHRILYANRADVQAVLHTHTTFAAALSCLRMELPPLHYLVAVAGENVRCAEYATFGTPELAHNALAAIEDRKACLLANHGLLIGASSMEEALNISMHIEWCCQLYIHVRSIGEPALLSAEEMHKMQEKFADYGQ